MKGSVQVRNQSLIIHVPKELDHHSALPIRKQAEDGIRKQADDIMMHQNIREVVMDFSGTDFMDSSGIGMMMGRYRAVQRNGGHMRAEHVNDRVKKILDMAGIGKLIEISKA